MEQSRFDKVNAKYTASQNEIVEEELEISSGSDRSSV